MKNIFHISTLLYYRHISKSFTKIFVNIFLTNKTNTVLINDENKYLFLVSDFRFFLSTFENRTSKSLHVFYILGIYLVFY